MRGWEWNYLTRLSDNSVSTIHVPHKSPSASIVFAYPERLISFVSLFFFA